MRISLLLHGHMRTFKQTVNSLKNLVGYDQIDIFIHTWNTIDRLTPSYYKETDDANITIDINEVKKVYNPVKILIETQESKNPNVLCPYNKISLEGHKGYFESFYKVNQLKCEFEKENSFQYDLVIKSRPDVVMKTKIDISKLSKEVCYLFGNPVNKSADLHSLSNFRAFNVITVSNSDNMNKIANFFKVMDKYIFVKLHKHSDYVDYILDVCDDIEIKDYFYGKDWGFIRL